MVMANGAARQARIPVVTIQRFIRVTSFLSGFGAPEARQSFWLELPNWMRRIRTRVQKSLPRAAAPRRHSLQDMKIALLFAALGFAVVSIAAGQSPASVDSNTYSIEQEIQLGDRMTERMVEMTKAKPDRHLQSIGDKLTKGAGGSFHYRFYIHPADAKPIEAAPLPGGSIFLARTLLSADDSRTAAILAHAMGHVAQRHYTRQLTLLDLLKTTVPAEQSAETDPPELAEVQKLSRRLELEADAYAVKLLIAAGYDPHALTVWVQSLPSIEEMQGLGPSFPPAAERVAAIEKEIATR
jgi:predicted Zn-dependent protease